MGHGGVGAGQCWKEKVSWLDLKQGVGVVVRVEVGVDVGVVVLGCGPGCWGGGRSA